MNQLQSYTLPLSYRPRYEIDGGRRKSKINNLDVSKGDQSLVCTPHLVGHSNLVSTEGPKNLLLTCAQNVEFYCGPATSKSNT